MVLEAAFFGAFKLAIDARKKEEGLTQAELAKRIGREKTGVSKLLSGPRNWTIGTISDLVEALGLKLEFALVDKANPVRRFTATGVDFSTEASAGAELMPTNEPDTIPRVYSLMVPNLARVPWAMVPWETIAHRQRGKQLDLQASDPLGKPYLSYFETNLPRIARLEANEPPPSPLSTAQIVAAARPNTQRTPRSAVGSS
jgi:transcriptional regulator with XRE-family HTH domain